MGVGAVFISTLALTRLPEPHDPPQNQQELLAATLQPIVSFVVLGSILIRMSYYVWFGRFVLTFLLADGLSIPFFTAGRRVHSRTLSLSQTLTSRQTTLTPDWLLGVRRPAPMNTTFERPDIEDGSIGRSENSAPGLPRTTTVTTGGSQTTSSQPHEETDATVISSETAVKYHRGAALGEAGMGLEDDSSRNRRLSVDGKVLSRRPKQQRKGA
jgi:sodium/hydrogen antiporter